LSVSNLQNLKQFIRQGKQAREVSEAPSHDDSAKMALPSDGTSQDDSLSRTRTYEEAAQQIVEEEKQAKNRLPRYPGLERFTLYEKMGEYVFYLAFPCVSLISSGAFSTVFKARNDTNGQMVAIKVVRKSELNSSQACIPFDIYFKWKLF